MSKDDKTLIKIEAVLTGVRPLKDGGMNLTFNTQEASKDFMVEAMQLYQQFGWVLFAPNEVQLEALPDDPANPPLGVVSPSRKLKNTIYALYMERGAPFGKSGFDRYYRETIERLRSVVLQEIDKAKNESA